jgi:hypothetical protein
MTDIPLPSIVCVGSCLKAVRHSYTIFIVAAYTVCSISISSQPFGSRISPTIYNCRFPRPIFSPLCLSCVHHSSAHVCSKARPLAHPSVASLKFRGRARQPRCLRRVGKLIRTLKIRPGSITGTCRRWCEFIVEHSLLWPPLSADDGNCTGLVVRLGAENRRLGVC